MSGRGFSSLHPAAAFFYFAVTLALGMSLMHPVCLAFSLFCSVLWALELGKARAAKFLLAVVLPMAILAAALNPAFNHRGETILAYLPNGNPLTLESLAFGAASGAMLAGVAAWCFCLNAVFDSDKLVCLFGRVSPALALLFSMTLRFAGRFAERFREVSRAQRALYGEEKSGAASRLRRGAKVFSVTLSWALESAVQTADAMQSRGYGLRGRTSFAPFRFKARDALWLAVFAFLGGLVLAGAMTGALSWRYFPGLGGKMWDGASLAVYCAYFPLCVLPLVIDFWEVRLWKRSESKI